MFIATPYALSERLFPNIALPQQHLLQQTHLNDFKTPNKSLDCLKLKA